MKKRMILMGLVIATLFLSSCTTSEDTDNTTGYTTAEIGDDGYQEVSLRYGKSDSGYKFGYILEPQAVKVGTPVRIVGDMSTLRGCYQYVQIPSLGISQYLRGSDNIIEFTPEKTGEYSIACSMGMAYGKLIVIE